jgi:uncharacterized protein YndB with AHSA1/START domain
MSKKARSFVVSATTTATREGVFALVANAETWPRWTPIRTVVRENLADDGSEQVGTVRHYAVGATKSVEEVTEITQNERFAYSLRSGMPISNHRAAVELEATPSGCTISWHEEFTPNVKGTGLLLEWFLRAFISWCLRGLVRHAEA